jgi:SAM-dependent methyltransferase
MNRADAAERLQGLDPRLVRHRDVWRKKEALRLIYSDYHRRLVDACPPGPLLDIGGGSGHIKEFRSDAISADILEFPGLDVVCDAHRLPFRSSYFAGIIMLDVLHHLERPVEFLGEAARALRPGGVLAMIEPGMSPISYPFYRYAHHEPADLRVDPFAVSKQSAPRDPFDSNQAIPTLLFDRESNLKEVERRIPELKLSSIDWLGLLAYPLSGGFKRWCLVPARLAPNLIRFENAVPRPLRKLFGGRIMVVFDRR